MIAIGCLHSAASNVPLFEEAAGRLGLAPGSLRHMIRPDLLAEIEAAGEDGPARLLVTAKTAQALGAFAPGCGALLLTCSSLGDVIPFAQARLRIPLEGAEAALLRDLVAAPGPGLALCSSPGTLWSTGRRLREAAAERGATPPPLRLIPGAWARFRAGEAEAYQAAIREALDGARAEGFATIALAQASMAPAAREAPDALTSPEAGLREILRRLDLA
ncbi:hypothetical protein [Neomegalonema sp.]|uniref:hypothetical protein n=1 Tax=Neomegalonema sp. TaxID=2039713 RepID=UPI002633352D|nr:hypothetical protein [Neomegalonema sp.]MDD2867907.1 hypothetical protein [Neomegalonema sp.]